MSDTQDRRRASDTQLDEITKLLTSLDSRLAVHMDKFEKEYEPAIKEYIKFMQRSKGIIWFLRALLYVGAPIGSFVYWVKDHLK